MVNSLLSQSSKKIGILGLARTGIAGYLALKDVANVVCFDDNQNTREQFAKMYDPITLVSLDDPRWQKLDKILISPGIPQSNYIFEFAQKYSIKTVCDIDLFFEENDNTTDFIAITGSNGKSTTTALTAHVLQAAGIEYLMGGNIGKAVLELPRNKPGYILEVSSFHLELIKSFRATIAILLNIVPNHLDRHHTMQHYIDVKKRILQPLASKHCYRIIGVDNNITQEILASCSSTDLTSFIPISAHSISKNGVAVLTNHIYDCIGENTLVLDTPAIKPLQGSHNRENIAASYAACRLLGLKPEVILQHMLSFSGLPHRMQYIGTVNNINFYNDSKATNVEAASKSLSTLTSIYWLVGGINNTGNIEDLSSMLQNVKKAYLFGKDKSLFINVLQDKVDFKLCHNMQEAFERAYTDALLDTSSYTKNILLAPAATSLDQFTDFEQRGNIFCALCADKIRTLSL